MEKRKLGIMGGSGLYAMDQLEGVERREIETPWGLPSGPVSEGVINGVELAFLARHGDGHVLAPSSINYRANIDALKRVGVTDIISISACGSLAEKYAPGDFVIVDQFIDRTTQREKSFFSTGCVAHVSLAKPVCPTLFQASASACEAADISHHAGGTYICIDGPQFSSKAESDLYRQWKADIIGMTNMPEAKLAREAEIPYVTVGMVTDYDCWREDESHVEVADVLAVMADNTKKAQRFIVEASNILGAERSSSPLGIERCLDFAMITSKDKRDAQLVAKLDAVAGRFFKSEG